MTFGLDNVCNPCKKGKQLKKPHTLKRISTIDKPLELLHIDLFGPIGFKSISGKRYCFVVTDDYTRFSWVKFPATKDETFEELRNLFVGLERLLKTNVVRIRSDNGTEFKNSMMQMFCLQKGIHHE